jgi:tetratricopeptide (TPR) repeat protein
MAAKDPGDLAKQIDMAQAISWTAYTLERQEKTESSLALYKREIAIYDAVLAKDPGNNTAKSSSGAAWTGIGRLETARNNAPKALAALQNAVSISEKLRDADPKNTLWRQSEVKRRYELGTAAMLFGRPDQAAAQAQKASDLLIDLIAKDSTNEIWNVDLGAQLDELEARLMANRGHHREALQRADSAIARLSRRSDMNDPVIRAVYASVLLIRGDMHAQIGQSVDARRDWQSADRLIVGENDGLPSFLLFLRFGSARRLGDAARAKPIRVLIDQRNWRHPGYLRELR